MSEYSHVEVALLWLIVAIATFGLVYFYANKQTPWFVYLIVFIGWLFPFSVVLLLPLDLASTVYRRDCLGSGLNNGNISDPTPCEKPYLFVSERFLEYSWKSIYWTMFVLTWFIVPFVSSYCDSGYFTAYERAKKSARANFNYLLIMAGIAICAVFWVLLSGYGWKSLLDLSMSIANIWGLLLVAVFLAFGLMEVPKSFWNRSNYRRTLRFLEFKAPEICESLAVSQKEYHDAIAEVGRLSALVPFEDPVRPFIDHVRAKCPANLLDQPLSSAIEDESILTASDTDSGNVSVGIPMPHNKYYHHNRQYQRGSSDSVVAGADVGPIDTRRLAKLHKRIIRTLREYERWKWEWADLCREAFHLQDIISRSNSGTIWANGSRNSLANLNWFWFIHVKPWLWRGAAILFTLASAAILWSEITYLITSPILSLIALVYNVSGVSYALVELMSLATLLYMCSAALHSLFRIRIFNIYSLHPNHHTSEVSLCWFTNNMCRLAFPLGYNFMYMAASKNAVLFKFMGEMTAERFQNIVPILVALIWVLNFFNVSARIMQCLGLNDDFLDLDEDNDQGWGDAQEGRMLLTRARGASGYLINPETAAPPADISTSLLSTKTAANKNYSSEGYNSNGERRWQGKDLSNTQSKYLLNNPLYEKYQKRQNATSPAIIGNNSNSSRSSGISNNGGIKMQKSSHDVSPRSWGANTLSPPSTSTTNNPLSSPSTRLNQQASGAKSTKDKRLINFEDL